MKPTTKTAVLRTLTLAVISAAGIHAVQAAESNYISVFGGLNSLDDASISSSTAAINSDFDEGFGVGMKHKNDRTTERLYKYFPVLANSQRGQFLWIGSKRSAIVSMTTLPGLLDQWSGRGISRRRTGS